MADLDVFDTAILKRLQADCRQTSEAIGDAIGLSSTAVQRRIKRLRESGAIVREVAIVDPRAAHRHFTAIVQVVMARGRGEVLDAFKRAVQAAPEVQQCYYVTGEFDFILVVTARDMAEYERLVRRIFFDNPDIHRFTTSVTMDPVKVGLEVPMD